MPRKSKYTKEQKIKACKKYLSGNKSPRAIARELNMTKNGFRLVMRWSKKFQSIGAKAFITSNQNTKYSNKFKLMVVNEYINCGESLEILANKYHIKSSTTILEWFSKYNRHKELEDYLSKPEVYKMDKSKTTLEERIKIVNWCREHNNNYKEVASMFNCSYAQVYNWVKKYNLDGEDGLNDQRGRRKTNEDLTDEEKLKRANDRLSRQNEELKRQIILLKKLNAFEWKE
ncbi:MAG: transposase [Erysipelotrichaceae bacterium]